MQRMPCPCNAMPSIFGIFPHPGITCCRNLPIHQLQILIILKVQFLHLYQESLCWSKSRLELLLQWNHSEKWSQPLWKNQCFYQFNEKLWNQLKTVGFLVILMLFQYCHWKTNILFIFTIFLWSGRLGLHPTSQVKGKYWKCWKIIIFNYKH